MEKPETLAASQASMYQYKNQKGMQRKKLDSINFFSLVSQAMVTQERILRK